LEAQGFRKKMRRFQGGGEEPPLYRMSPGRRRGTVGSGLEDIRLSVASGSKCGGAREEEKRRRFCYEPREEVGFSKKP
jgi:hypothetical protein